MQEDETHVRARGLYKVFGEDPQRAVALLEGGKSKSDLLAETGMGVGVREATFEVRRGEVFVIMGLSGSGKSTLLRLVNRLIEPSAGTLHVLGRDMMSLSPRELVEVRRSSMAMVFQSFALMPHLDVLQNVMFGLRVRGTPLAERQRRARAALELVGLEGYARSDPSELSGGMQQRVGLARALCVRPHLLLMDEAFSALDPLIREDMQSQLMELQEYDPRTILFVSHDLAEAVRIGDRIAIMDGGEIVQIGTPQEILQEPASDFVRSFVAGVDQSHVLVAENLAAPTATEIEVVDPLPPDASLQDVARRVIGQTDPVTVRRDDGTIAGWITKDEVLKHLSGVA